RYCGYFPSELTQIKGTYECNSTCCKWIKQDGDTEQNRKTETELQNPRDRNRQKFHDCYNYTPEEQIVPPPQLWVPGQVHGKEDHCGNDHDRLKGDSGDIPYGRRLFSCLRHG
ncbi:MAG TPA: hypothetical protein VHI54_07515, partial [Actinomycetota bacterium]|nr:hypothetical protein [Actinomycetota bacterium]